MKTLLTLTPVVVGLLGCPGIVGSGRAATETRTIGAFRTLRAENGFRVTVTKGARALSVTADDNVLPVVETVVEGDVLVLRVQPGLTVSSPRGLVAALTTDVLEGVTVGGGGKVTGPVSAASELAITASGGAEAALTGVMSSLVTLTATGGSTVSLSGSTTTLRATAGGGSIVTTRDLTATTASLDLSGGSQARVSASNEVTGSASGGSTVVVSGNPGTVNVDVSGGSTVTRAN